MRGEGHHLLTQIPEVAQVMNKLRRRRKIWKKTMEHNSDKGGNQSMNQHRKAGLDRKLATVTNTHEGYPSRPAKQDSNRQDNGKERGEL